MTIHRNSAHAEDDTEVTRAPDDDAAPGGDTRATPGSSADAAIWAWPPEEGPPPAEGSSRPAGGGGSAADSRPSPDHSGGTAPNQRHSDTGAATSGSGTAPAWRYRIPGVSEDAPATSAPQRRRDDPTPAPRFTGAPEPAPDTSTAQTGPLELPEDKAGPTAAEEAPGAASAHDPSAAAAPVKPSHGRHAAPPAAKTGIAVPPAGSAGSAPPDASEDSEGHGTETADPHQSRHSGGTEAPARPRDPNDPDDPDNLAGWVTNLVGAVDDGDAIAGRRTGAQPKLTDATIAEAEAQRSGDILDDAAPAPSGATNPEDDPLPTPVWFGSDFDDDYEPTSQEAWNPAPAISRDELVARLEALATLVEIGRDDFDSELISRARHVLTHAGARLRLSDQHSVVALAGGTGSGKSSLFNALCGLEFSRVGITRPTTSAAYACVWGTQGAGSLLDWLSVPPRHRHSRASELDKDDSDLSGLILLDLPDHDSVQEGHALEAQRLIGAVDLLVWVLDPQKYADAAVHHRYFAEMAGHGAVMVAVLNQVDRVDSAEVEELLTDLRRLLETESGVHPRVLTTSALTGQGIRELRQLLKDTVAERRVSIDRLVADLNQVAHDFQVYRGSGEAETHLPENVREGLVADLAEAAGVTAIADAVETSYDLRGGDLVGWPVARWIRRLRRDPLRSIQLDFLREGFRNGPSGSIGVQPAEINTALLTGADRVGQELPEPWPQRIRSAARSDIANLPNRLGQAIASTVPADDDPPSWWKFIRAAQFALVTISGVGLAWFVALAVSWLGGGMAGMSLLDNPVFAAFAAVLSLSTLLVGWLMGVGCRNLVSVAAARRREEVEEKATASVRSITAERVVAPLEEALGRYHAFSRSVVRACGEGE
ncbi:GTPase [Salinactinospora qingdaonensis]|uniref:G domain-containing protein n=1 Tax=Salinactinospora qingdaonensis TaxID=702744 RepID=A0ABP7EVB7_9ACTN